MNLRPYQEVAADFLFERDRAMILAPVGAGVITQEHSSQATCERAAREIRSNVIGGMGYSCNAK